MPEDLIYHPASVDASAEGLEAVLGAIILTGPLSPEVYDFEVDADWGYTLTA